jgi:hypothetical protein
VTDRTDLLRGAGTLGSDVRGPLRVLVRGDRAWQSVLASGLVVLTAATVTAFVASGDPASANTYVTSVTNAVIALPDGSQHAARIGALLPEGATIRTGAAPAGAVLTTAGRDVYVGGLSSVRVLDGVRETLERGQVMVDSRRGPRLALGTTAGTVTTRQGALTRVERGVVLRLGVFQGAASLAVEGRQATVTVPALYQVMTQYGALPGRPTALALTPDDPWERRLAANLVEADEQLTRWQKGLRGTAGEAVLSIAPAGYRPTAAGTDLGEAALSFAVAEAATAASSVQANYDTVRTSRTQGGSWGVVAAIVRATVSAVSSRLDAALPRDPTGPAVVAGTTPNLPGIGPSASPTTGPDKGGPHPPTPTPTVTVTPSTTASPTVADQVVTIVKDLLPTPTPTLLPGLPAASPAPTPLLQLGPITIGIG